VSEILFVVDIEPTNRCNASCHFCPRDQTPHQGLMSPEVFEQALQSAQLIRSLGNQVQVNLCGLGEPLLNKHTPAFVERIREEGFRCGLSSNGALLDEARATALIDAGLNRAFINIGDIDDSYEDVYKLPFEKTRDRILRFIDLAPDDLEIFIVLVDYKQDKAHLEAMRAYWEGHGVSTFMEFEVMNRGGALFVDHMQYSQYPERARAQEMLLEQAGRQTICTVPFNSVFIGYDGNYYLCCSDWKKEAPLGSVFDETPVSIMEQKLVHVLGGEPVCKTCNLDPVNRVTDKLREVAEGEAAPMEAAMLVRGLSTTSEGALTGLNNALPGVSERAQARVDQAPRPRIPVTVVPAPGP
jgi:MoaA/NifB/PqqE/SkfB family radical SAM enzyme